MLVHRLHLAIALAIALALAQLSVATEECSTPLCTICNHSTSVFAAPLFDDISRAAGLPPPRPNSRTYGAPALADLDRDGFPDLLLCQHDAFFVELFFNAGNGSFVRSNWRVWHDSHGLSPAPLSAWKKSMHFSLSVGGNFGNNPGHPLMFVVHPESRAVSDVSNASAITSAAGRGRTAVYMDLSMRKHPYWPDVLFLNAQALSGPTQFASENVGNLTFAPRPLNSNFANSVNPLATVTDINNDGQMELIAYWDLHVWNVTAPFTLQDVSHNLLPTGLPRIGVIAITELDFDNDGFFDLYLARTRVGPWLPDMPYNDILLRNVAGKRYEDFTARARVPLNLSSKGVTAADFNNDGFIDLHIVQGGAHDVTLLNNGDSTFRRVDGLVVRAAGVPGDHAVAVDYDLDGRVDLVLGEGSHETLDAGAAFRLLRNVLDRPEIGNFLHVRVANAPGRTCTPLHARVEVRSGDLVMVRRVGSPGSSVSHSYLETVHFGLGHRNSVDLVHVTYTDGYVAEETNVRLGQIVVIGVL